MDNHSFVCMINDFMFLWATNTCIISWDTVSEFPMLINHYHSFLLLCVVSTLLLFCLFPYVGQWYHLFHLGERGGRSKLFILAKVVEEL